MTGRNRLGGITPELRLPTLPDSPTPGFHPET